MFFDCELDKQTLLVGMTFELGRGISIRSIDVLLTNLCLSTTKLEKLSRCGIDRILN